MFETIFRLNNLIAVFDILIVAAVLYWLMLMFKGTRAERMLWGIAVIVIIYFVSQRVELLTLHWILSNFLGSIVIFIIVVFQQDIRKALIHVGRPFSTRDVIKSGELFEEISKAVVKMSRARVGGIIVIERAIDLSDICEAGVEVDAKVSKDLLLSIFNASSPMHDGAVVIKGGRLMKAGCILPLTDKELPADLGTRHRAAMGLAEETDAVIVVVSEETGKITLAVEESFETDIGQDRLESGLKKLFEDSNNAKSQFFPWKTE